MSLPRGTVTFLFSDVEGSTQLQHALGESYQDVVETHRRLLETTFASHAGIVVDRQTESFFCVFQRAQDAVQAAVAAQRGLAAQEWPDGVRVRVRMGIHVGEPEVAGDRYVGLDVSRAARICAAAHGGQVLLSSSARALVADRQDAALRDLGSYRLKDFPRPERISQLVIDGVPARFPPLRTGAGHSRRNRVLLGAGALLVIGGLGGLVLAVNGRGHSGRAQIGPTSVGVIDAESDKLVGEVPLGYASGLLAAGAGHIWAVDPTGSTLTKIDPRTMQASPPTSLGALGTIPTGISVGGGAVWVGAIASGGHQLVVLELEPKFGTLEHRVLLEQSRTAYTPVVNAVLVSADRRGAWVLEEGPGKVRHVSGAGTASPGVEGIDALSIAVGAGAVWLGGRSGVTRIDPATGQPLVTIPIGRVEASQSASIAAGAGGVWFAASGRPTLSHISPSDNAVAGTAPVGGGPSGVAAGEGAVWVANSRDGTVSRVNRQGSPTTIRLGPPLGAIVTYGGRVWTGTGRPRS